MAWADYWPILSPILGALGGATVLIFSKSYFGERAKNLATKHDIAQLQRQLRENTEITKEVEQAHARADVLWRSDLDYRERQLSEFYGPAYGYVRTSIRFETNPLPSTKQIAPVFISEGNLAFSREKDGKIRLVCGNWDDAKSSSLGRRSWLRRTAVHS